jgi:energy-coupling factor transport system ATP-binding protein
VILTLDGVSFTYPHASAAALRDLSITVAAGESLAVVGADDAGKSTLCLVASGLVPSVGGGTLTGARRLAGTAALVVQNPAAQLSGLHTTVFEEVAFGPRNLGLPRQEVIRRTRDTLAEVGIDVLAMRNPAQLSGGETALVALAGAVAMRPALLVLDQPVARLDADGRRRLLFALAQLRAAGIAMLITEHDADFLVAACDHALLLREGGVARNGPAGELLRDRSLFDDGVLPAVR